MYTSYAIWICLAAAASPALASSYTLGEDSSLNLSGLVATTLDGTLIGDWESDTNPDGTRTLPGVWGGSGNNPIPISITISIDLNGMTIPSGSLDFLIDSGRAFAQISELNCDLLNGSSLPATTTASFSFETFRTVNPDSLFVGGIPIEIPAGTSIVTKASVTQTAEATGTAVPIDDQPGAHDIEIEISMTLDMIVSNDTVGDIPLALPLLFTMQGTHQAGDVENMLMVTLSTAYQETVDLPDEPLPTIPLELPTILPPGDVAGLLLDLTPSEATTSVDFNADLMARHPNGPTGDLDGDGLVGIDDLLIVLAAFGPCPGCDEDLDGDGAVTVSEVLLLISQWS